MGLGLGWSCELRPGRFVYLTAAIVSHPDEASKKKLEKSYTLVNAVEVPDEAADKLVSALKQWAVDNFIHQAELARMLSVSPTRLNQWFTGKKRPNLDAGLRIQALLKTKPRLPDPVNVKKRQIATGKRGKAKKAEIESVPPE